MYTVVGYTLAEAFKGRGSDRTAAEIGNSPRLGHRSLPSRCLGPRATRYRQSMIARSCYKIDRTAQFSHYRESEDNRTDLPLRRAETIDTIFIFPFLCFSPPIPLRFPMEECRTDFISFFLGSMKKEN